MSSLWLCHTTKSASDGFATTRCHASATATHVLGLVKVATENGQYAISDVAAITSTAPGIRRRGRLLQARMRRNAIRDPAAKATVGMIAAQLGWNAALLNAEVSKSLLSCRKSRTMLTYDATA